MNQIVTCSRQPSHDTDESFVIDLVGSTVSDSQVSGNSPLGSKITGCPEELVGIF
jgi:hypothetical protein